ncbi:MAG: four helix bundle protein [Candidatus Omnitrophica bacterium]|nr:four helix bundle protein [Candidatus Omnitrophota bacterium]
MPFAFERLEVYQKSLSFVDAVYELSHSFPAIERFGLSDQLRRAAVSIALNIAEGSGRTKRDFAHFLRNARASCYECVAILQIVKRRAYITQAEQDRHVQPLIDIAKMLSGLIRSLGGHDNER